MRPPLKVLLVEDESILLMDLENLVEEAGHEVVGEAYSLYDVQQLDHSLNPQVAFVDVQLARGTSGIDVARHVRAQWPDAFIFFVTANPLLLPPDLAGAHGVIRKPYTRTGMLTALRYITEGVCDPPPRTQVPAIMTPAPAFDSVRALN